MLLGSLHPATIVSTPAIGLGLLLAGAAAVAAGSSLDRMSRRAAFGVGVALLSFQALHLLEHAIQLGYWVLHPSHSPYMTPWALEGVAGLAWWFGRLPIDASAVAGGTEGLHLIGNVLFLVGILALRRSSTRPLPGLQIALVAQGLHVVEHVLLTATLVGFGTPIGASTLFGMADGVAWGATLRVWFHFLINAAATAPAALALWSAVTPRAGAGTTADPAVSEPCRPLPVG